MDTLITLQSQVWEPPKLYDFTAECCSLSVYLGDVPGSEIHCRTILTRETFVGYLPIGISINLMISWNSTLINYKHW